MKRLWPNMPARELRTDFLRSTPLERLLVGADLSYTGAVLAACGRRSRGVEQADVPPLRVFELLQALSDRNVGFVVIGGFAVILHGYERMAKNVDIVPDPSPDNLARLWSALVELETHPRPLRAPRADRALQTRLGRVSVMQSVSGVESYEELHAHAVATHVPQIGATVWFAGVDDLIAMKQAAGRP